MGKLKSYNPCHSETLVFVGAGATASLGMPTTEQQGDILECLAKNCPMEERVQKMKFFQKPHSEFYIQKFSDFLTILDYKNSRYEISPEAMAAANRLFERLISKYNIPQATVVNRIHELRTHYDLVTLLAVYKDNCPDDKPYTIQYCYSFLDKMSQESRDFSEICCLEKKENAFAEKQFYLSSTSFVSFNFEVAFLSFLMNANGYLNKFNEVYIDTKKVMHWIDFGTFKARDLKNGNLVEGFGIDEGGASRMNRDGSNSLNRIIKFHFAHGTMNVRECPICGRTSMFLDNFEFSDSGSFKYGNLMPPLPFPLFDYEPKSLEEENYQRRLHTDSLQCVVCGSETFNYSSPTIMQSLFKLKPSPFLEEVQRELRVALSKARHIVLLGYSLPIDDTIWVQSFVEALRHLKDGANAPYCSIVVGYLGEKNWIEGKDIDVYFEVPKKCEAEYGYKAYEIVKTIFKKENIRLYAGGIPQIFGDGTEKEINELLYPDFVNWTGTRLEK